MQVGEDELTPLAGRVAELARSHCLAVVSVVPDSGPGHQVRLGPADMTSEAFVDLAAAAGGKLFYLEASVFDIGDLDELAEPAVEAHDLDSATRDRLTELRRIAAGLTGWPTGLQAAFVSDGVVHRWIIGAGWLDDLADELGEIFPDEQVEPVRSLTAPEQSAIIDDLASDLLHLSAFRAAGEQGRRRVARTHLSIPGPTGEQPAREVPEMLVYEAIRAAMDRAAAEEQRHYAAAEQQIPELARLIATEPAYRTARTAAARRHRARDYLLHWADGYPPPTRILDLVLDALSTGRTDRTDLAPTLPFTLD